METKIVLTIMLPGATLYSADECKKEILDKDGHKKIVIDADKMEEMKIKAVASVKPRVEQLLVFQVRKAKPAKQTINISEESYNHMLNPEMVPSTFDGTAFIWKRMSKNQKLRWHMQNIAESLGGTEYSFSVVE